MAWYNIFSRGVLYSTVYWRLRGLAYATPLHRWLRLGQRKFDRRFWDQRLSGEWRSYLGSTFSIEARNALIGALLRHHCPGASAVLDLGCAAGSLAHTLRNDVRRFVGVDISEAAVAEARQRHPHAEFHVTKLEAFTPECTFDVIVFGEVLYYLSVEEAVEHLTRYAKFLSDDGLLIVTMKNDPKSSRIFYNLMDRFRWVNGALIQEKIDAPEYRI